VAVQPWDSAKSRIFLSRSARDIPLLGQQRSRSCSKTTQNPSLFELLRDVFSKNFKPACPLFGFSCSFHFTNAVLPVVSSFRGMACAVYA
jgi:hypothetical protein